MKYLIYISWKEHVDIIIIQTQIKQKVLETVEDYILHCDSFSLTVVLPYDYSSR